MLRIVLNALRTGVVTQRYPTEPNVPPDRFRGAPLLRPGSHLPPPSVCPVGALSERADGDGRHVGLDLARCIFCGRCADDPWADAITMGRDFELASRSRDDLRIEVVADGPAPAAAARAGTPESAAAPVSAKIRRVLGRSLHLRHLDAGSCNACDWELTALLNPTYDVPVRSRTTWRRPCDARSRRSRIRASSSLSELAPPLAASSERDTPAPEVSTGFFPSTFTFPAARRVPRPSSSASWWQSGDSTYVLETWGGPLPAAQALTSEEILRLRQNRLSGPPPGGN
jgi:Fe-S-cluster-containing hydrogenase component 2